MTPFDNFGRDPFEELVSEFFGGSGRRTNNFISESDHDESDILEDDDSYYLIFELPGYNEKDVNVEVSGNELTITFGKRERDCDIEGVQNYLAEKLSRKSVVKRILSDKLDIKNFSKAMNNGLLEVTFNKK